MMGHRMSSYRGTPRENLTLCSVSHQQRDAELGCPTHCAFIDWPSLLGNQRQPGTAAVDQPELLATSPLARCVYDAPEQSAGHRTAGAMRVRFGRAAATFDRAELLCSKQ